MALGALFTQGLAALSGGLGTSGSQSRQLAAPSASELAGEATVTRFLPQMGNLVEAGPGMTEVQANMGTQRDFASMLQNFSQGGFLPGQSEFATANQFAQSAFAPQQTAINQQFQDEQLKANQLAARMGRPVNDPLIQAKLSQERQRAQERLGASQSAYVSEFAQSLPTRRLGYMGQLADLRSGLATQALANRQALVGLGSQIENAGRSFRAQTMGTSETVGGGLGGAINGLLGGIGSTMKGGLGGGILDLFNGGGNSAPAIPPTGGNNKSMLGIGDLNQLYGFGSRSAPTNFGQTQMFGQLTGVGSPARARVSGNAPAVSGVSQSFNMPAFSQQTFNPAEAYRQAGDLNAILGSMGFSR